MRIKLEVAEVRVQFDQSDADVRRAQLAFARHIATPDAPTPADVRAEGALEVGLDEITRLTALRWEDIRATHPALVSARRSIDAARQGELELLGEIFRARTALDAATGVVGP